MFHAKSMQRTIIVCATLCLSYASAASAAELAGRFGSSTAALEAELAAAKEQLKICQSSIVDLEEKIAVQQKLVDDLHTAYMLTGDPSLGEKLDVAYATLAEYFQRHAHEKQRETELKKKIEILKKQIEQAKKSRPSLSLSSF